jgi:membrane protein involved in colicin uptake
VRLLPIPIMHFGQIRVMLKQVNMFAATALLVAVVSACSSSALKQTSHQCDVTMANVSLESTTSPTSDSRHVQMQYLASVRTSVEKNWFRPAKNQTNSECVASIRQREDGCITQVEIKKCDDKLLESSLLDAMKRSSPLPKPPAPFERYEEISFVFKLPEAQHW